LEKVIELGSFAKAAEETNRSQSSVSYNRAHCSSVVLCMIHLKIRLFLSKHSVIHSIFKAVFKVIELGSFAKAAEETNRSQSSVSYNLALLQERLGGGLVHDSSKN
jgi:DNA-binding transcriptional LysR family regulator